ncbi:response regulator transcription factor [Chitinophaga sp. Cy-1792]|uniref:helix-turn-helix transcriptional regulator n=1 Tax=Chitinophaga sp. Cy-1792 TaxID=2608339 RepID=UPI00142149AB|nr:response regulator transcription factor [Chitinophaga sp. Cy-1792]NIG53909.1 helix-turn-helix transcriptional regulator [Chitinophaga sp. Cy-1792]
MSIVLSAGHYFGKEQQCNDAGLFRLNITDYQPETLIQKHYHENAYLSMLLSGGYREISTKSEDIILPGEVLFRPAGYTHANHFHEQPGRCLNIEFNHEALREILPDHQLPASLQHFRAGVLEDLYKLLYHFFHDPNSDLSEEYILHCLADMTAVVIPSRLPWFGTAQKILENDFDTHHTIKSLAAAVFVHPIYLARAFKERTGLTVGEYQLKMRTRRALQLLITTALPIADIAYAAGFADTAHLIRSFKSKYRTTPLQFRRLLK